MPPTAIRLALTALLVVGISAGVTGCRGGSSSSTVSRPSPRPTPTESVPSPITATGGKCHLPPKEPYPAWLPNDLPMPPGTYSFQNLTDISGFHRVLLAVPNYGTRDFARLVLNQWPDHGWVLGRGDAEPGEVEDSFSKGSARGAFKANDVACKPGFIQILLIYAPKPPPVPAPTFTPSSKASASPLHS